MSRAKELVKQWYDQQERRGRPVGSASAGICILWGEREREGGRGSEREGGTERDGEGRRGKEREGEGENR